MRLLRIASITVLAAAALVAALPTLGHAEIEKAVIQILGGMQCSL